MNEKILEIDEYLPLGIAAERFFPAAAGVTVATLRKAIRDGRLSAIRPGRRILVCRADVMEMLKRSSFTPCQGKQKAPGSISGSGQAANPSGSFSTGETRLAQDAASGTLQKLKQRFGRTSKKNINPPAV
ncbi:MAG: helix-turn-helix domain-containing protein, partial [Rhodomicrobium sp.]